MDRAEPIAAYEGIETIAKRRSSQQEENNGSQPGNPDLAAQALLDTLELDADPAARGGAVSFRLARGFLNAFW